MGIKATVVYDIVRHTSLVLRTLSVSIKDRYEVLDTIASFSEHCESLRGIAYSAVEVSALWRGPPYVTYNLVHNRFRAIIIWDEGLAEFDLAYDVYHALMLLENAITNVAEDLMRNTAEALSKVYEEAGYALSGDKAITLPSADIPKKPRQKLINLPSSSARKPLVGDPQRKKSTGSLLGRIGSVIKSAKGSSDSHRTASKSSTSLRPPPGSNIVSPPPFGSEAAMDDTVGELDLPEEVFAWANFGAPLPDDAGDLVWFDNLLCGNSVPEKRSRVPLLRAGSVPSTPLTIPSTRSPLSQGTSGPSSIVPSSTTPLGDGEEVVPQTSQHTDILDRTLNPGSVPVSSTKMTREQSPGDSSGLEDAAILESMKSSTGRPKPHGLASVESGSGLVTPLSMFSVQQSTPSGQNLSASRQQPVLPRRNLASSTQNYTPSLQQSMSSEQNLPLSMQAQPTAVAQQSFFPAQQQSTGLEQQLGRAPQTASEASTHMHVPERAGTRAIGGGLPSQNALVLASGGHGQQNNVGSDLRGSVAESKGGTGIPGLEGEEEEFDVSEFGAFKDSSQHNTRIDRGNVDEAIRSHMNEFANTMQLGNFSLALQQVMETLKFLSGVNPRRDREIQTCSNYVLAQRILIRHSLLEEELRQLVAGTPAATQRHVDCAMLTMFLAEMKHLLPRHRVAAMKVAVEKNAVVGNFGMCARWLRLLVEKAPPRQKAVFVARLQKCVQNGGGNRHMPATNKLCYVSLMVVGGVHCACSVCGALFHGTMGGMAPGQVCCICYVGMIEMKV